MKVIYKCCLEIQDVLPDEDVAEVHDAETISNSIIEDMKSGLYSKDGDVIITDASVKIIPTDNWRDDPMTDKQLNLISEMMEFSDLPLPEFTGKTKGEASDWITANMRKAHETALDSYEME